jgi:hypothetical protein
MCPGNLLTLGCHGNVVPHCVNPLLFTLRPLYASARTSVHGAAAYHTVLGS